MDLRDTIAPRSDQMNAEDLLTGPRTFTVDRVSKGSAEQPVDIHLVEFPGRPFRPSKTVRRILVNAWGPDANAYTGRRMTLYRDPAVKFGGMDVGGIRVSHLSHIDKPVTVALTVTRGKRLPYTVQPLAANQPATVVVEDSVGEAVAEGVSPTAPHHDATSAFRGLQAQLSERAKAEGWSRDDVKAWVGLQVGRPIASTNDLSSSEVGDVRAILRGARREVTA